MTGNLNDSISSIYKSKEANNDSIYQQQKKASIIPFLRNQKGYFQFNWSKSKRAIYKSINQKAIEGLIIQWQEISRADR